MKENESKTEIGAYLELPDGSRVVRPPGARPIDVLQEWRPGAETDWIVARVNGSLCDLAQATPLGAQVHFVHKSSPEGLSVLRHSAAHVVAQAVTRLFPDALPVDGPATEDGFFYDFAALTLKGDDLDRVADLARRI